MLCNDPAEWMLWVEEKQVGNLFYFYDLWHQLLDIPLNWRDYKPLRTKQMREQQAKRDIWH